MADSDRTTRGRRAPELHLGLGTTHRSILGLGPQGEVGKVEELEGLIERQDGHCKASKHRGQSVRQSLKQLMTQSVKRYSH